MCKEDIRIARNAVPQQVVNDTGKTAAYKVLSANPNRYSLFGNLLATTLVNANEIPMLAARVGGRYFPLILGGSDGGFDVIDIRRTGQTITYEIWFVPGGAANTYSVYCGETAFNQSLGDV